MQLNKRKICIATPDIIGPVCNGGVGTAYTMLAETLVTHNYAVTILYLLGNYSEIESINYWIDYYAERNIQFIPLSYQGPRIVSVHFAKISYQAFLWLKARENEFDVVHFAERKGGAYYSVLAKHQGLAFQRTTFCIGVHSPTLWSKAGNQEHIDSVDDLVVDFLERESVRLADVVISPCQYMLDWMKEAGWHLPTQVYVESTIFEVTEETKATMNIQDTVAAWIELHEKIKANVKQPSVEEKRIDYPLVSVCLIHYNRPHYLAQALESLRSQDYPNYEIILVDDASSLPEAQAYLTSLDNEFASKGWQLIRHQENRYADAARNTAFRHSRGEYLLFMDDDNYAKPYEISTFVAVAQRTHADILTCAMDRFSGPVEPNKQTLINRIYLPIGAAIEAGVFINTFGDMNALIKKSVLTALGGFTDGHGAGYYEDWEFFANAVLKGFHLETIPLALFWYRDTPDSLSKTTNVYRNLRRSISPYVAALPPPLRNIVLFSQGQYLLIHRLNQRINEQNKMTAELPNGLKRLGRLMMQELSQRVVNAVRHPLKTVKTLPRKIRDFSIYE